MSRLLARIAVLIAMFAVLLALVRLVGETAVNPLTTVFSEILLPNGEKQACWHGICPGITSVDEGKAILDTLLSYRREYSSEDQACWQATGEYYGVCVWMRDGLINRLGEIHTAAPLDHMVNKPTITLGDMVTLWGIPIEIDQPFCGNSAIMFSNNATLQFSWALYSNQNGQYSWVLDPALPQIAFVTIASPAVKSDFPNTMTWQGFIMQRGYMTCGGE